MKKIEGVDEQLETLDGIKMVVGNGDEAPFTIKKALLRLLGSAKGSGGDESITIMDMGIRLKNAEKDFIINESDNEEAILKRIVNDNITGVDRMTGQPTNFPAFIIGAIYRKVKAAVAFTEGK